MSQIYQGRDTDKDAEMESPVTCDRCGKTADAGMDMLPKNWWSIAFQKDAGNNTEHYDFCFFTCMEKWIQEGLGPGA